MQDNIRFSVLVPVYNVEAYLSECIESVLQQTYQNFELILIDDGSTDTSPEICNRYAEKDERVQVYHQQNKGLMMSRKEGVLKASGEFCLFLDSDDYYDVTLLEKVDEFLRKTDSDIAIFKIKLLYQGTESPVASAYQEEQIWSREQAYEQLFDGCRLFSIVSKAVKRDIILQVLDETYETINYAEDALQTIHFYSASNRIGIMKDYLYYYRMRRGSIIHKVSIQSVQQMLYVITHIIDTISHYSFIREEDILRYKSFALNDVLENLYQLDNQKVSMKQSIEAIKMICSDYRFTVLLETDITRDIKVYNKPRLWCMQNNHYHLLFIIDKMLMLMQSVQKSIKKEKKFD